MQGDIIKASPKSTRDSLRESEERWVFALESSGHGVWDWNVPANAVFFSHLWKAILGYDDGDIKDAPEEWLNRIHPQDLARVQAAIREHLDGKTPSYVSEYRMRCRNGSYKWILDRGRVFERGADGQPLRVIGTHTDITERKKQDDALEQLSLVASHTINGVVITDKDGLIEWVNDSFTNLTGYGLPEVLGKKPGAVLQGPDTDEETIERIRHALQEGNRCEETLLNYTKDGRPFYVQMRIDPVRSSTGELRKFVALQTDVTERVLGEKSLRENKERLRLALEASGDGIWEYEPTTKALFLSARCKEMLGYSEEEIGDTLADWEMLVHPDDLEAVRTEFYRHVSGEATIYRSEHRLRCRDGTYKWVLDRGRILDWTADRKPLRVIGTHSDISELRAAEERARRSEERLRVVLNAATGVAVISSNAQGVIDYFSRGAESLLGYTSEEMTGKQTPVIIHDPEELNARARELTDQLGEPISGFRVFTAIADRMGSERREWTYICKDGSRKFVDLYVYPLKSRSGEITGYLGTSVDITERRKMESELRTSEQKFRGIFEFAPVGMALNDFTTGAFIAANQSLLESVGRTWEEFATLSYWDITPKEYQPQEDEQLLSLRATGRYGPYQKEFIKRDGRRFPVLLQGMLIDDAEGRPMICSIVQDISEIKRIEEELRDAIAAQQAASALLRAAGRIARIGHWELKIGESSPYWSDITCQIHEVPPGTRVSLDKALDFYLPEDRCYVQSLIHQATEEIRPFECEARLLTARGNVRWVQIRGEPVTDETGRLIALRGVFQDIDDRHRAANLLEERNRLLEIATQRAEAHAKAKAEFLANMSHEIRTPLNAVIGMSELLTHEKLDDRAKEFVDTIHSSGDMLLSIINDILDFSKIESGQLELEEIAFSIRECVESAIDIVSPQASHKNLELLCWVDPALPSAALGDPSRLRQVLVNLVTNAIKFTPSGQVFIKLTKRASADASLMLRAEIKDSGIGIPADRMEKLFQAFSQVDSSTTRRFGGTGLGLAITQRLIEMMKGRIWVDSIVDKGSVFQFEIPIQSTDAVPADFATEPFPYDLAGLKVLIVDDNATNLGILKMQVKSWGISATLCKNAREALQYVQEGYSFDLAIFDVVMPGMDGYELIREVRKVRPELPVIVLTSMGPEKRMSAEDLGISVVLSKPVKIGPLSQAIRNALGIKTTNRAAMQKLTEENLAAEAPLRILVAEDNAVNQRVADLLLRRLGYDATMVGNGKQVLERLRQESYDVVFLDIQMPEMDGLETAREICRVYPESGRPWLIALTAHAVEGDREDCLAAGMNDYLSKPVRSSTLAAVLKRAYLAKTA